MLYLDADKVMKCIHAAQLQLKLRVECFNASYHYTTMAEECAG